MSEQQAANVQVRPSSVEGLGVFATRAFAEGERISVVNVAREITAEAPLRPDDGERFEHLSRPDGRVVLYGLPDRHLNHSCDPNAWERYVDGPDGAVAEIVVRRAIVTDEEIRVDYLINNSGGDSWPCGCGVARCRGMTSYSFFTIPIEQQREYLPLLADWFVARHPEEVAALRREVSRCRTA